MTKVSHHPLIFVPFTLELINDTIGWSDSRNDHGTYRWSYTWFDAGASRQGKEIVKRRTTQANVHASLVSRVHTNVWKSEHPDTARWFGQVAVGDDLLVFARSSFPGWTNYVDSVHVDLCVAL